MTPVKFPECNAVFGPPQGFEESQVMKVDAYTGQVQSGSVDGVGIVVVAWQPTPEELAVLNEGKPLFLTFVSGLLPHYPSVSFREATHPA